MILRFSPSAVDFIVSVTAAFKLPAPPACDKFQDVLRMQEIMSGLTLTTRLKDFVELLTMLGVTIPPDLVEAINTYGNMDRKAKADPHIPVRTALAVKNEHGTILVFLNRQGSYVRLKMPYDYDPDDCGRINRIDCKYTLPPEEEIRDALEDYSFEDSSCGSSTRPLIDCGFLQEIEDKSGCMTADDGEEVRPKSRC